MKDLVDVWQLAKTAYLKKHGFGDLSLKAVLFDMDGVLFDSMPLHASSWQQVCHRFGLHMSPDEAYRFEGRTGASTIDLLVRREWGREATPEEVRDIYEEKCKLFNAAGEAQQMPGAEELLHKVQHDGLTVLVVTGSGQLSLLRRLESNFPGVFSAEKIISSKDVVHGKPSPEPYLKGLEKAGVRPWEALVVENAPLGVRAGVAAGVFTVALNTGPLPDADLLNEGADVLFPSMQAFCDAWESFYTTVS